MHVATHHAVDAETHDAGLGARLDVNVARALHHRVAQHEIRELDDRRGIDVRGGNCLRRILLDSANGVDQLFVDAVE